MALADLSVAHLVFGHADEAEMGSLVKVSRTEDTTKEGDAEL